MATVKPLLTYETTSPIKTYMVNVSIKYIILGRDDCGDYKREVRGDDTLVTTVKTLNAIKGNTIESINRITTICEPVNIPMLDESEG